MKSKYQSLQSLKGLYTPRVLTARKRWFDDGPRKWTATKWLRSSLSKKKRVPVSRIVGQHDVTTLHYFVTLCYFQHTKVKVAIFPRGGPREIISRVRTKNRKYSQEIITRRQNITSRKCNNNSTQLIRVKVHSHPAKVEAKAKAKILVQVGNG